MHLLALCSALADALGGAPDLAVVIAGVDESERTSISSDRSDVCSVGEMASTRDSLRPVLCCAAKSELSGFGVLGQLEGCTELATWLAGEKGVPLL
eukprot:SAG31_NODE_37553_length_303_cov_0.764706_1_plen_95_part_01